jgi:hypothetical protein
MPARLIGRLLHRPATAGPADIRPYEPTRPAALNASFAETKQMWTFLDGAIMSADVRQHLWRSRGMCTRHTWLFAITEIQRRGRPFTVSVLSENLLCRAAVTASRPRWMRGSAAFLPRGSCLTCDYLAFARDDSSWADRRRQVNRRDQVTELLHQTEHLWRRYACPVCLDGDGPPCRPHLLAGDAALPADIGPRLRDVHGRLHYFMRSMTWMGPAANDAHRVAWIEALGFLAGWSVPNLLTHGRVSTARPARVGSG